MALPDNQLFASLGQKRHSFTHDPVTGQDFVSIPEVCGGFWWAQLHSWAENIRDDACPSCGEFAVVMAQALHDVVNAKLGKPLQHPDAVAVLAKAVLMTMEGNPAFGNNAVELDQDGEVCELVPNDQTFEASLFHADAASLE